MPAMNFSDVENSLLHFRIGRRLILDRILELADVSAEIQYPALFLSRLFVRLKSADSIVEKIKRKNLPIKSADEIPNFIDDLLGLRIIVENEAELQFLDRFLTHEFKVKARLDHAQDLELGNRTIDYSLVYEKDGQSHPFETQLRTFLQHYWAGHSFFLFHKANPDRALPNRDDLLALSDTLQAAEHLVEKIQKARPNQHEARPSNHWQAWPLRTRVHLMVIKPQEQFIEQLTLSLTGNDEIDHRAVVEAKTACYQKYPDARIVECICANFASFLFNEPQVNVSPEFLGKAIW